MHLSHNFYRYLLLFWCLFIAVGAVVGALGFWIDPSGGFMGMQDHLKYFQKLPLSGVFFRNYIWCGVALLLINGITNFLASYLIIKDRASGIALGTVFGGTLILWIILQLIIFPLNIIDIIFLVIGLLQLGTGLFAVKTMESGKIFLKD